MAMLRRLVARLAAFFRQTTLDREFDDEAASHLAMLTDDNIRRGMAPDEARRAARLAFGGQAAIAEQHREVRTLPFAEAARQDLAYAIRMFRRSPWFSVGAVLTLALGVGANGAVYGILRAVILQPLPYREPNRVVMVWRRMPNRLPGRADILRPVVQRGALFGVAAGRIHAAAADVMETATYQSWQGNLEVQFDLALPDRVERLRGAAATANFFDVLGVAAARGRVFSAADEQSAAPLLVISDALWHRAFGADPGIVGRSIRLMAGRPQHEQMFAVIGVLPAGVRFTYPEETEAWTVMPWTQLASGASGYWTVARLAPGASLEVARARVAAIPVWDPPHAGERPENHEVFALEPVTEWVARGARPSLLLLGGVAALLLLIACATVAGALFVRVTERQKELALRAAIGAGRGRLVRQLLTEGLLLSACGAALGSFIAALTAPVLRALVPASIPRANEIRIDFWIVAYFALAAAATTILAALAPAWRGTRFDVVKMLKQSAASGDRSATRWRQGLVGIQSAVSTALLLTAALLIVSFWKLSHVPLGFDGDRVLTVEMRPISPKYAAVRPPRPSGGPPGPSTPSLALIALQRDLVARVRALPGVLDAGLTSAVPFRGVDMVYRLDRVGTQRSLAGNARFVDPGFFSVLNVPLVRGRLLTNQDTPGHPRVMLVSEEYAHQMFGAEDPLGKMIDFDGPVEVVGVVADLHYKSFDADPMPAVYFPSAQQPSELTCVVARLAPTAGNLEPALRAIVKDLDPDLPAMNITTIDRIVSDSVLDRRFYTTVTTVLASLALILTGGGLIVVVSRAVVERRREMAIRAALGARARDLVRSVMVPGMTPVVVGIGCGLAAVSTGAALLRDFLFHTSPHAPAIYAGVATLVLTTALIATLLPARRAAAVSPSAILRAE